ncbi:MAG: type I-E CRISPR-associated protein Cas7/Cse4/CasC [Desulfovibrio piger]|uniref:type I-E CRISPR-associated protein Cas7/Cse4/CasC n=1 Tax=Desulfovibrio piger TaxID=901 RepID=UPI00096258FD|nr:type I-E CRISPR-associated protein Cas7/Cse4/CasC [Desulfovibrio piger]OLA86848.1 MAG: type I-E CRISPR-associated protein Cas7/Cse4/CasC [Desulfovibrio piger]
MRHLELHILQSVPVACLNRDDFGSPKTALFGNVQRARVSSQCWKRAVRELMQEEAPALFGGQRTRLILDPLCRILHEQHGLAEEEARKKAEELGAAVSKLDTPPVRVKTLFFTSPLELEALAAAYVATGNAKKAVKELAKQPLKDAADIALFGRMVASDHSLTLEGAAMFSHALSTHKVSNEIDFFAAVDDLQPEDEAGAGMTGTLEFNSATYYRFAALNLDLLEQHLSALSAEERREVVCNFVTATLRAVPGARKNSMNAATLPSHVLAVVREKGHPVQLVNAFEKPVWTRGGLMEESVSQLEREYTHLKETWGLEATLECRMPELSLSVLLQEVEQHVR